MKVNEFVEVSRDEMTDFVKWAKEEFENVSFEAFTIGDCLFVKTNMKVIGKQTSCFGEIFEIEKETFKKWKSL